MRESNDRTKIFYRKKDSIYSPVIRIYQGLPEAFISAGETAAEPIAEIQIPASEKWIRREQMVPFVRGDYPLYLVYQGEGEGSMLELAFFADPAELKEMIP